MASYVVYHPPRQKTVLQGTAVYHDSLTGNQCPYVWNDKFLHSFCHITQMSVKEGDITFWVSGDTFPDFEHLWCDLVFRVESRLYWANANTIMRSDSIVDSDDAFRDHYCWASRQHPFKRRRRYTLKAHPTLSWQPQVRGGALLDLVPKLRELGLTIITLRKGLRAGFQAKPLPITNSQAGELYSWIERETPIKLLGRTLVELSREVQQSGSEIQEFCDSNAYPTRDYC